MSGTLVVSLDLELFWGVHDVCSLSSYAENLRGVRGATKALLSIFEEFGIHATWAVVGLLACRDQADASSQRPSLVPSYDVSALDAYRILDQPGLEAEFYFAPEVIEAIAAVPGQEIATHTFSHYYCLEPGQTPEQFRADLRASLRVLSRFGPRPRSIVFPRNQYSPSYLRACAEEGLEFFRGNPSSALYDPHEQSAQTRLRRLGRLADSHLPLVRFATLTSRLTEDGGLIDVSASRFLRPARRTDPGRGLRIRRIREELRTAAETGGTYHLWWHPHNTGGDVARNIALLREIFGCYRHLERSGKMRSLTMVESGSEIQKRAA